ncbi:hypothetical protein WR25_21595 [Diploscapter pachys]|uniref:Uncharacterized protein n=1 Tax=Diploscapter pachys TaxID=2018661 RepID=A0A2A2KEE2_9BILA|nr:hypothetical protein WR25_21595 [Diploscapter pachys]
MARVTGSAAFAFKRLVAIAVRWGALGLFRRGWRFGRRDGRGGQGPERCADLPLRHAFGMPPPPGGGGLSIAPDIDRDESTLSSARRNSLSCHALQHLARA